MRGRWIRAVGNRLYHNLTTRLIILLALAGLTTAAIVKKHDVFVTIQTEKVGRRNITELVVANGKIQPVLQVKISPEVSGEIIELPVKEGQCVQKGDLLVKIKPDFYLANRKQAEASYNSSVAGKATAEANLAKAPKPKPGPVRAPAKSTVRSASPAASR